MIKIKADWPLLEAGFMTAAVKIKPINPQQMWSCRHGRLNMAGTNWLLCIPDRQSYFSRRGRKTCLFFLVSRQRVVSLFRGILSIPHHTLWSARPFLQVYPCRSQYQTERKCILDGTLRCVWDLGWIKLSYIVQLASKSDYISGGSLDDLWKVLRAFL